MDPQNLTLIPAASAGPLAIIATAARDYVRMAKAPNTLRAYRSDWADFTAWCERHGQASLPATPETVALYLSDLASTAKVSTLTRRMSAISQAHQMDGLESPVRSASVRTLMAGIRRTKGTAFEQKEAAHIDTIRAMVGVLDDSGRSASPIGLRDRALLLIGFAGAFRRAELVSLDREDLEFTSKGVVVTLRRSKTDQEAEGRKTGIPYGSNLATCPVRALESWLTWSRITAGPLFRAINRHGQMRPGRLSDKAVALVVKKYAAACGLDPEAFSGHSLRAGFATSAGRAGVEERDIMRQTGHRSTVMVRRYIREGALFRDNAAGRVGL